MYPTVKNIRKLLLLIFLLNQFVLLAEHPLRYKTSNTNVSVFKSGWIVSVSPDLTFYENKQISGIGISFEPSINEYISLNYKFALNYSKKEIFSVHGTPGTVISPYLLSFAFEADSNRGGWVVLSILTLLLPEGVNYKIHPANFNPIMFSVYFNPFGIDYVRRLPTLPKTIYMSGETGVKAYFNLKNNFFAGAFGGTRVIYRFRNFGFSAGFHIGYVFPQN